MKRQFGIEFFVNILIFYLQLLNIMSFKSSETFIPITIFKEQIR